MDPARAPLLVAYAFGRRDGDEDPVNARLARRVEAALRGVRPAFVVTQRDIARRLAPAAGGARVVVVEDHLPDGVYASTEHICRLARRLHTGGPVMVVAHARHRRRALATHRVLGLRARALPDLPDVLDRASEQWWTRTRPAWTLWQAAAWTKVAVLLVARGRRRA